MLIQENSVMLKHHLADFQNSTARANGLIYR